MSDLLEELVRVWLRRGLRRGVFGGERVWIWIGAGALGLRLATRLFASEWRPVRYRRQIDPGQTIVVRHLLPGE
jgi:hypothetical protein